MLLYSTARKAPLRRRHGTLQIHKDKGLDFGQENTTQMKIIQAEAVTDSWWGDGHWLWKATFKVFLFLFLF